MTDRRTDKEQRCRFCGDSKGFPICFVCETKIGFLSKESKESLINKIKWNRIEAKICKHIVKSKGKTPPFTKIFPHIRQISVFGFLLKNIQEQKNNLMGKQTTNQGKVKINGERQ